MVNNFEISRRQLMTSLAVMAAGAAIPVRARPFALTPAMSASAMTGATIPLVMQSIQTSGFIEQGDGGGASYRRVARKPDHPFAIQDASGAWFEGQANGRAISPAALGAFGRSQNEGPALQRALEAAMALGVWLRLEPGRTYVLDPSKQGKNGWMAIPRSGQSVLIDFNGATLKFADNMPSTPGAFWHLFSVPLSNARGGRNRRVPLVHLRRPRLDGNARMQPRPRHPDDYEQRALIRIAAHDGNRIDRVIIENAYIEDRVADGLSVGASTTESDGKRAPIARCDIIKPRCSAASHAVRAFISVGSGCSHTRIIDPQSASRPIGARYNAIETEYSSIGRQHTLIEIEGGTVDALELGAPNYSLDHSALLVRARGLTLRDYYVQAGGSIETEDCDFAIGMSNGFAVHKARHTRTRFRHLLTEKGDVFQMALRADYVPSMDWQEQSCRHVLAEQPAGGASGAAIRMLPCPTERSRRFRLRLVDCTFAGDFPMAIDSYGGGTVETRNCRMVGKSMAVRTGAFGRYGGSYTSVDDDWRAVSAKEAIAVLGNAVRPDSVRVDGGRFAGQHIALKGRFAREMLGQSPRGVAVR